MTEQQTERLIGAIEEISSELHTVNQYLREIADNSDSAVKELIKIDYTLNE